MLDVASPLRPLARGFFAFTPLLGHAFGIFFYSTSLLRISHMVHVLAMTYILLFPFPFLLLFVLFFEEFFFLSCCFYKLVIGAAPFFLSPPAVHF